jgi:hypothetical protein
MNVVHLPLLATHLTPKYERNVQADLVAEDQTISGSFQVAGFAC